MKKKIKLQINRIIKLISLQEMQILPGHLAFNIVLMIVPIFSIIGVLGSNIDIKNLLSILANNVPDAVLNIIDSALNSVFSDLEDAIQYYTAQNHQISTIVTRNLKDYKADGIVVQTPEMFLCSAGLL